jgi:hypothetical protein
VPGEVTHSLMCAREARIVPFAEEPLREHKRREAKLFPRDEAINTMPAMGAEVVIRSFGTRPATSPTREVAELGRARSVDRAAIKNGET